MSYRMDIRTKKQFINDIKRGNKREHKVIELFKNYLLSEFGFVGEIKENGCDMSGSYIQNEKLVTSSADYVWNGVPLEVKTSSNHTTDIFIKVGQLHSYIKQNASILYANGVTNSPSFTLFTIDQLKHIKETCQVVVPPAKINGGKKSYKVDVLQYEWLLFEGGKKNYERCSNSLNWQHA